jgi:hypothetical protein
LGLQQVDVFGVAGFQVSGERWFKDCLQVADPSQLRQSVQPSSDIARGLMIFSLFTAMDDAGWGMICQGPKTQHKVPCI